MPNIGAEMTEILDTNVIVRFLVGDIPKQKEQALQWFVEAENGKREIIVNALVIAETVFVLESFYKQRRLEIATVMEVFLSQRWLIVPERKAMLAALEFYRQNKHFVDCYLVAWSRTKHGGILTFDKKLEKFAHH